MRRLCSSAHVAANPNLFDVGFSSRAQREGRVLLIVAIMLVALAVVNAIFIARATVQDARHTSAVTRALGGTPQQLTAALSTVQVLPALAGAVLGIPAGAGLFAIASQGGTGTSPPAYGLIATAVAAVTTITLLTAFPARTGARTPPAEILQSETP